MIEMHQCLTIKHGASFAYTVGPIFGLMGFFASFSGVGANLFNAINAFIGHWKGGLAMATQVASAGFGAICGSPPATISTFSAIAYPEMRRLNYAPQLAGTTIAAGAVLSVLIPPSSNLILYGIITENSIGRLFVAGIIPGIMIMLLNCVAVKYMTWRKPEWGPASGKHSWSERIKALRHGGLIEIFVVFFISMGGMFAGFFTPTEAGAVGAFGMLIVTLFTRAMNWRRFVSAMMAGVRTNAMLFSLLAGAAVLGKMFTLSTLPVQIGAFVQSLDMPKSALMVVILLIYFVMGMLVDLMPMMIVTMPVFYPIVVNYLGYDPLWFGVMLVILIAIGGITPPVGTGIFILYGCVGSDKEASIKTFFSGVWPFVVVAFIGALIMVAIPQLATFLPKLLYG